MSASETETSQLDTDSGNPMLWRPSEARISETATWKFMQAVNQEWRMNLSSYDELYDWSINRNEDFWEQVWDQFDVLGDKGFYPFLEGGKSFKGFKFFPTAKLNYAENLLRERDDEKEAIVFWSEDKIKRRLSYKAVCDQVSQLQQLLSQAGVGPGDRVAAFC